MWLGSYGADSPKPIIMYSNSKCVQRLARPLPKNAEWNSLVNRGCNGKVSGNSLLKGSQAYPEEFGKALAAELEGAHPCKPRAPGHERSSARVDLRAVLELLEAGPDAKEDDTWKDVRAPEILWTRAIMRE